jgi:hypothetical protein
VSSESQFLPEDKLVFAKALVAGRILLPVGQHLEAQSFNLLAHLRDRVTQGPIRNDSKMGRQLLIADHVTALLERVSPELAP